jgi:hypothetical protein
MKEIHNRSYVHVYLMDSIKFGVGTYTESSSTDLALVHTSRFFTRGSNPACFLKNGGGIHEI